MLSLRFRDIIEIMRIWTIQDASAWDYLNEHGLLQASRDHQSDNWPAAYEWMRGQLIARVGPPPLADSVPLWGWHQWSGQAKKRPDLRFFRHHWGAPGRYVLLECELPDASVMLSDFVAWHHALNGSYLELSGAELESYEAGLAQYRLQPDERLAERLSKQFYKSWERIIDMDALKEPDWHDMEQKSIQACFWRLDLDQVRSVKPFNSVSRNSAPSAAPF